MFERERKNLRNLIQHILEENKPKFDPDLLGKLNAKFSELRVPSFIPALFGGNTPLAQKYEEMITLLIKHPNYEQNYSKDLTVQRLIRLLSNMCIIQNSRHEKKATAAVPNIYMQLMEKEGSTILLTKKQLTQALQSICFPQLQTGIPALIAEYAIEESPLKRMTKLVYEEDSNNAYSEYQISKSLLRTIAEGKSEAVGPQAPAGAIADILRTLAPKKTERTISDKRALTFLDNLLNQYDLSQNTIEHLCVLLIYHHNKLVETLMDEIKTQTKPGKPPQ